MSSTKRITIAACGLFLMLGFIAGGVSQLWEYESSSHTEEEISEVTSLTEPKDPEIPKDDSKYILKIEDGIVVVFNDSDMTRPIIVTDIYASTLRHFDREQLTAGLIANDDFELQSMLEDFSS